MDTGNDTRVDAEPRARPFQFSLRTMFIVTTIVAVLCSGLFSPWEWVRNLTLLYLFVTVPMVAVVGIIYSRGYARTFWIGAVFPAAVFILCAVSDSDPSKMFKSIVPDFGDPNDPDVTRFQLGLSILIALLVVVFHGLTAMGVRWMVESSTRTRKPRAPVGEPPLLAEFIMPTPSEESKHDAG